MATWTFDDDFSQESIEAVLAILQHPRTEPDGGFVKLAVFGSIFYSADGDAEPSYLFHIFGGGRLLETVGLCEVMKLWAARQMGGGPIPDLDDD